VFGRGMLKAISFPATIAGHDSPKCSGDDGKRETVFRHQRW